MIGEIPWRPSSFCQTKVGSFGQWRDDPSPEHRMDGGSGHFEPSPHASSGRSPGCCDGSSFLNQQMVRQMVRRPEGLDGRLATVGLRQPAHSLPTIPTRLAIGGARRYIDGDWIVRHDDPPDGP